MAKLQTWATPSEAADMVYQVRGGGAAGIGFALLRQRRNDRANSTATLAFAKLNPVEPTPTSFLTRCGWPVTARDHRLILAPGAADPVSIARLFTDYDAAVVDHQRLLAAVLTIEFSRDRPVHDSFDELVTFATAHVARQMRLTSLAVLHAPGDQLATNPLHGHLLILGRVHTAAGWLATHPGLEEDRLQRWADDWASFVKGWRTLDEG
jgi:hypothetical protein